MSDELALFAVLCLIYGADCFLWVGKHSLAFTTWMGRQWRDRAGDQHFRTSEGGILLLNPLPPLGGVICCHLLPLSLSPEGVCSLNCQTLTHAVELQQDILAVPFEAIYNLTARGRNVLINDERLCRCRDTREADRVCSLLNALRDASTEKRAAIIHRFWEEQFDYEAANTRLRQAVQQMGSLRALCNTLSVLLFIVAPVLVLYFGLTGMLIPIALGMFVLATAISAGFYARHRRFFPVAGDDRISNLIKMIMCPPVAIRACDLITESLLSHFNPLVVGQLLLDGDRYRDFAVRTLRNLQHPLLDSSTDRRALEICGWQNRLLLHTAFAYLREVAHLKENLLAPPLPDDAEVRAYCPRCLVQFSQEAGACSDCPGVKLLPFDGAVSTPDSNE
jgi:hypothetical protein